MLDDPRQADGALCFASSCILGYQVTHGAEVARKVREPAPGLGMRPVRWPVGEVSLVQSVTDPAGARYEVLERWALDSAVIDPPGSPVDPPQAPDWPQR